MQNVPVCPGCRKGGGREGCEIRGCAAERHLGCCGECRAVPKCRQTALLQHMRAGALEACLRVEECVTPAPGSLDLWAAEVRARWPLCL